MSEAILERQFQTYVFSIGGVALKLKHDGSQPGFPRRGIQDRWAVLPGGLLIPVELKEPGGKLSPQQIEWQASMRRLGFDAIVSDNIVELIDKFEELRFEP